MNDGTNILSKKYLKNFFQTIELNGTINRELANDFIARLSRAAKNNTKYIFISIHSNGGSIYEALRIIEAINMAKRSCIIGTIIDCIAFSIAVPIFCLGEEGFRFVAQNAQIMIHQPVAKANTTNNVGEVKTNSGFSEFDCPSPALYKPIVETRDAKVPGKESKHLKNIKRQLEDIIIGSILEEEDLNNFVQEFEKNHNKDWFLTAQDMLYYGLANHDSLPRFVPKFVFKPILEMGNDTTIELL